MNILFRNAKVIPMTDDSSEHLIWFIAHVAVSGDTIVGVGDLPEGFLPDETIDAKDHILMPGLVNCHTHLAMSLFRGMAEDMTLMSWLQDVIWPAEAKHTDETIRIANEMALAEMIRSGTTSFLDMYFKQEILGELLIKTKMRGVLSRAVLSVENKTRQNLDENIALKGRFADHSRGLISVFVSAHAPYTVNDDDMRMVRDAALEHDMGLNIHISETNEELMNYKERYHKTPVAYLRDLGLFQAHTLAAHCVHITDDDINILYENDVCVSHNPTANLKLASGIAPLKKMLEKGITVGLGTDGVANNNNMSLFHEMRLAALLQKGIHGDATAIPVKQVLSMATVQGAKALKLQKIGQIAVGNRADLILIDSKQIHMKPGLYPPTDVVYAAGSQDVTHTMVNGEFLMKDRRLCTIDEEQLIARAHKAASIFYP